MALFAVLGLHGTETKCLVALGQARREQGFCLARVALVELGARGSCFLSVGYGRRPSGPVPGLPRWFQAICRVLRIGTAQSTQPSTSLITDQRSPPAWRDSPNTQWSYSVLSQPDCSSSSNQLLT